ncbi:hypothetical protein CASFOL_033580 [Castilleja foliolosa]|uniref:Late embryogenesis abundant protein LEA-2 subgroup domain-containing protein n=1 Tax=Castilleja foliolosa TaxID=1961234 RepID=A0ABD3BXZ5_9LAMI
MAETSEQIHPIASPANGDFSSDDRKINIASTGIRHGRRLRRIKCCCYTTGILLILAAAVLTLIFTIFKLKAPTVRVHKLTIGKLDLANGTNMTLNANVWVKNPSFAYFTYNTLVTTLLYRGGVVGESRGAPGKAKARRTTRVNVTVDIMTDRILLDPNFDVDLFTGLVNMSSYTRVGGRMKLFVVIDKKLTVWMRCNMTFNITSRAIQHHKCKRKVKL